MNGDARKSPSEVTSEPSAPTIRGSGAETPGGRQRLGWSSAPAPRALRHPRPPLSAAQVGAARPDQPGVAPEPLPAACKLATPPRPRPPAADRRPSPEEGVGAVVVDLGLGAAAARGRAFRRLLQRRLAYGHRGPQPRYPGAPALAPPHGAWALCRSAPRFDLTHTGSPRTCRARRWERREGVAAIAGGVSGE